MWFASARVATPKDDKRSAGGQSVSGCRRSIAVKILYKENLYKMDRVRVGATVASHSCEGSCPHRRSTNCSPAATGCDRGRSKPACSALNQPVLREIPTAILR